MKACFSNNGQEGSAEIPTPADFITAKRATLESAHIDGTGSHSLLEIGSLSRANQAGLLPIFPAQPSAAYFLAQLPQLGSFYLRQAVSTTAFIQVCLGDPVADRLFVGFKLSGQLTGLRPAR